MQPASVRSADPIARSCLELLRDATTVDLAHVHEACGARLRLASTAFESDARGAAVRSLRASQGELGLSPSKHKYDGWRTEQDVPAQYMSGSAICRAFGTWQDGVAAAGGSPRIDVLSRRSLGRGPAFTRPLLIQTLKDAAAYYRRDWMIFDEVRAYALQAMREDPTKILPISLPAFSRGGGFVVLMHEAGLRPVRSSSADAKTIPTPGEQPYGPEDFKATINAAHAVLVQAVSEGRTTVAGIDLRGKDPTRLTRARYTALRADGHDGATDHWPSITQVLRYFGNWSDALHESGLLSDGEQAAGVMRKHPPVDPERARGQLRELLDEHPELTQVQYDSIVAQADPPADGGRRPPSSSWLKRRYTSFESALADARGVSAAGEAGGAR